MNYTEAFAAYGAKLKNRKWSVSAFGADGNLVVCFWQNYIKPGPRKGTMIYKDTLSNWLGNVHGRNEFAKHLRIVQSDGLKLRLAIAHPKNTADEVRVGTVADETSIDKTFSVMLNVIGTLEEFDGNSLRVVFEPAAL